MSNDELDKHLKYIETVKCLKQRQYYLTCINQSSSSNTNINNLKSSSTNLNVLAHDYLESDFRDKLLDIEEQIYGGSLGSLKVPFLLISSFLHTF